MESDEERVWKDENLSDHQNFSEHESNNDVGNSNNSHDCHGKQENLQKKVQTNLLFGKSINFVQILGFQHGTFCCTFSDSEEKLKILRINLLV